MNISVMGLGMVSKLGNTEDLERLLAQDRINPSSLPSNHTLAIDFPADSNVSPNLLRRMSHFAKISLLSASHALKDSGLDLTGKSVGIIQGSVYGPIISGIQAFDDLIDFGDNQLSPTNFSGSVFNASATYLSLAFNIQGCILTHTSGLDTLYNSLLTASLWLESKAADYVVMGIGDEYTTYFDTGFRLGNQQTGLLPTCEGWTTFILSNAEDAKYGKVEFGCLKTMPEIKNQKNIYSNWHDQIQSAEFLNHAKENQACFPVSLRGSYPSAAAFDLALALICARSKRFPVYNSSNGNYEIQNLNQNEKVRCYNTLENKDLIYYKIS